MRKIPYLFVDLTFIPLLEGIADSLGKVKGVVVLTDRQHMPESKLPNLLLLRGSGPQPFRPVRVAGVR